MIQSSTFSKKTIISLFICVSIYFIALSLENSFIFTKEFFFNNMHGFSKEAIFQAISDDHDINWANYVFFPIYILGIAIYYTIAFYIILILLNKQKAFFKCFEVALFLQIVYAINYIITVLLKILHIIDYNISNVDDIYSYQSLTAFIGINNFPQWSWYLLTKANITEFTYLIVMFISINHLLKVKKRDAFIISTSSFILNIMIGNIIYLFTII